MNKNDKPTKSEISRVMRMLGSIKSPAKTASARRASPLGTAARWGKHKKKLAVAVAVLLAGVLLAGAELPPEFFAALNRVETGGRDGAVLGDNGRSLGPLQISRAYWQDSRVPGDYGSVTNRTYAEKVALAYLQRYCPAAVRAGDAETCARIHNGGPAGAKKAATLGYWRKVKRELKR